MGSKIKLNGLAMDGLRVYDKEEIFSCLRICLCLMTSFFLKMGWGSSCTLTSPRENHSSLLTILEPHENPCNKACWENR